LTVFRHSLAEAPVSDLATPHPPPDHLRAYGRGLLSESGAAAVEEHLAGCDTCCRVLEGASADEFLDRLRGLPIPIAPVGPGAKVAVGADGPPRFRIEGEIGRGGMGVVYLARQLPLNRPVALKMLLGGERAEPKELIRFLAEAETVAAVRHPHIVQVYEYGESAGRPYLALEYLPGGTLSGRLKAGGALDARPAAELVEKLARAAQAAHDQGIVHRDLKPGNVLFDADGVPRVTDFGLAKRGTTDLTRTQVVLGTPAYMAPEQTQGRGKFATPETDVWALGVILYECLTGARPFDSADSQALLKQIAEDEPAPPRGVSHRVPRDLATICLKCLRKAPEKRYRTAQALADDLSAFLEGRSISARRPSLSERAARWSRRHPRRSTALTVGLVALLLVVGPATLIAVRSEQMAARRHELAQSEAVLAQQAAVRELKTAQVDLTYRASSPASTAQVFERVRGKLAQYGVGTDPGWADRPGVQLLSAEQQAELRRELGSALLMMARSEMASRPAADPAAAAAALQWNRLAEECFPPNAHPRQLAAQRRALVQLLPGSAPALPSLPSSALDAYYDAVDLEAKGLLREALARLIPFTEGDHPGHVLAWGLRGVCHQGLGQYVEAVGAFTVFITLWPDLAWPYVLRGYNRMRQKNYQLAEADFTRALARNTGYVAALENRARARERRGNLSGAEADLTAALRRPDAPTRLYFARSEMRAEMGNKAGAEADAAEGLGREPTDAASWVSRAFWKRETDPTGAIKDFDAALRLDPHNTGALSTKAHVLGVVLKRPAEAVAVLDTLLKRYPDFTAERANRAIFLAHMGEAKRATADVAVVLAEEPTPDNLFQMAGVYAQLSKTDPMGASRQQALEYLAKAFRAGYSNFDLVDRNADLVPLRDDLEFKAIVKHATTQFQIKK
jgi:tetratricopeptide (TPR) repeat protein